MNSNRGHSLECASEFLIFDFQLKKMKFIGFKLYYMTIIKFFIKSAHCFEI